jgi:hypothetical protein
MLSPVWVGHFLDLILVIGTRFFQADVQSVLAVMSKIQEKTSWRRVR